MAQTSKPYKGMAMEGLIASWYAKATGRDRRRFHACAREVPGRVAPGGHVLEVAPGPGYLAIEIARLGPYRVTGLDVSRSFVRMARRNAAQAGVAADFHEGDAAHMPFPDATFDYAVCMAAFKNFTDPLGAIDEIHRVLKPGASASIYDLRKDASLQAIDDEVRGMRLSRPASALTRWIFRSMLLKRAYAREDLERLVALSRFGTCRVVDDGIGFELRLTREDEGSPAPPTRPGRHGQIV